MALDIWGTIKVRWKLLIYRISLVSDNQLDVELLHKLIWLHKTNFPKYRWHETSIHNTGFFLSEHKINLNVVDNKG